MTFYFDQTLAKFIQFCILSSRLCTLYFPMYIKKNNNTNIVTCDWRIKIESIMNIYYFKIPWKHILVSVVSRSPKNFRIKTNQTNSNIYQCKILYIFRYYFSLSASSFADILCRWRPSRDDLSSSRPPAMQTIVAFTRSKVRNNHLGITNHRFQ